MVVPIGFYSWLGVGVNSTIDIHVDGIVDHLCGKTRLDDGFTPLVLDRTHIELPAVPRTSDDRAAKVSLSQWAPLVRTDPVQREKGTVDIKQRHDLVGYYDFQARPWGTVNHRGRSHPVWHSKWSLAGEPVGRPVKIILSRKT